MKRSLALVAWLGLWFPVLAFAQGPTAEQILAKVSQNYRNLHSFNFIVGREPWTGGVMGALPGRIRLRTPSLLLVSNGDTTWTYLPELNEYTETSAALFWDEDWDASGSVWLSSDIFRAALRPFRYEWTSLPSQKGHAKLEGESKLKLGGKDVNFFIVACTIDGLPHKLWVEQTNYTVWRDEWLTPPDRSNWGTELYPLAGEESAWQLRGAGFGAMPDGDFIFTPPGGARRVESFSPPKGYKQVAEERVAGTLLGIDPDHKVKGKNAPDFTAEGLDGKPVHLSDLKGNIVVLFFWASWCRPCQKDLEDTQNLRDQFGQDGVAFLGIDDEDAETVKESVKANGYKFPILVDRDQAVHRLYAVRWAPFVVVIDRKGKVADRYVGARGEAGLRSALEAAGWTSKTAGNAP